MAVERIADSTAEPLSLQDAKDHVRVASSGEDIYIEGLIRAARKRWEGFSRRGFLKQKLRHTRDAWPRTDVWELPRGPMFSTTAVKVTYRPSTGGTQTFDSTNYIIDDRSMLPRLVLKDGESWPSTKLQEAIGIDAEFEVGYGKQSTDVPENIRHALRLTIGSNFEHREDIVVGSQAVEIPQSARQLMWQERIPDVAGAGDPRL